MGETARASTCPNWERLHAQIDALQAELTYATLATTGDFDVEGGSATLMYVDGTIGDPLSAGGGSLRLADDTLTVGGGAVVLTTGTLELNSGSLTGTLTNAGLVL